jgi:hypothetical protein
LARVDAVGAAIGADKLTGLVLTDQAHGLEGEMRLDLANTGLSVSTIIDGEVFRKIDGIEGSVRAGGSDRASGGLSW